MPSRSAQMRKWNREPRIWLFVCVLFFTVAGSSVAQTSPADDSQDQAPPTESESTISSSTLDDDDVGLEDPVESLTIPLEDNEADKDLFDRLEQLTELILGLLGIVLGLVAGYFKKAEKVAVKSKQKAEEKLRAYTKPVEVPLPASRNSIVLLGIGGSGKTTLIKKLFATEKANPEIKTQDFEIYKHGIIKAEDDPASVCWLFVADYKGQNLGTLVRAFMDQQQLEFSPIRYKYVNSLVLVADLFHPPKEPGAAASGGNEFAEDRVEKNIALWNEQALDAIFGLLTSSLSYVCLFVNKIDLLQDQSAESLEKVKRAYSELLKELENRSPGAEVQMLVGSAERGDRLPDLRDRLIKGSVQEAEDKRG